MDDWEILDGDKNRCSRAPTLSLEPSQPPIHLVPLALSGGKAAGGWRIIFLHLVPSFPISGTLPPLHRMLSCRAQRKHYPFTFTLLFSMLHRKLSQSPVIALSFGDISSVFPMLYVVLPTRQAARVISNKRDHFSATPKATFLSYYNSTSLELSRRLFAWGISVKIWNAFSVSPVK